MEEEKKKETTEKVEEKESFSNLVKSKTETMIKNLLENDEIQISDIKTLGELVDIHKDIVYEECLIKEEMNMRYNGQYGEYGEGSMGGYGEGSFGRRGVPGTGRGRYSEGSYGRRGVKGTGRGRYRGEEMMDEMMYHYGNYSEGSSYGAEGEAMESLSNLMESAFEYFKELKENANSQDEIKMMEHYFKKMSQL